MGLDDAHRAASALKLATRALMSEDFHTRVLGLRRIPAGKRPSATPAHQAAREIGKIGSTPRLGSPVICQILKNLSFSGIEDCRIGKPPKVVKTLEILVSI
jgi:hypothetical protein